MEFIYITEYCKRYNKSTKMVINNHSRLSIPVFLIVLCRKYEMLFSPCRCSVISIMLDTANQRSIN